MDLLFTLFIIPLIGIAVAIYSFVVICVLMLIYVAGCNIYDYFKTKRGA